MFAAGVDPLADPPSELGIAMELSALAYNKSVIQPKHL